MAPNRPEKEKQASSVGQNSPVPGGHSLREQDALWAEFLALGAAVIDSLDKSIQALCDGRLELIADVKHEEEESDRKEVQIEQECLRILARYEPVASDLRRMATVLKINHDWERIADLAVRIARRGRKLSRDPSGVAIPEGLKTLARDALAQVRASFTALARRDAAAARAVIAGDNSIDQHYRLVRDSFRENLGRHPEQLNLWLRLLSSARNLERIADHAVDIARTVVYLQEGIIIRHKSLNPPVP
jgi:phosphate transport system protein